MSLADQIETVPEVAERLDIDKGRVRKLLIQGRFEGAEKDRTGRWMIPRGTMPSDVGYGTPGLCKSDKDYKLVNASGVAKNAEVSVSDYVAEAMQQ